MKVYHSEARGSSTNSNLPLPVKELTLSDLQQAVKSRFSSFCTAVGIRALLTLMEQDVETVSGPKGKHNPERTAYRHGFQETTVPMGNQRIAIKRPRVRSTIDNQELPISSYEAFNSDDELLKIALNRISYGISTPVPRVDGVGLDNYTAIVALGITSEGHKIIMGLRIGSTENSQVCRDLLTDLIERGLQCEDGLLAVIDGSKALRKALKEVFGERVLIQRCQVHKMRNVLDYPPRHKREWVKRKLKKAWTAENAAETTCYFEAWQIASRPTVPGCRSGSA